ncbi:MAG: hypothetical protein HRT36_02660 [Alphaproteobacteria bacterium]|nr:hypothetical protein [Alphaproteobacteria bacterium]
MVEDLMKGVFGTMSDAAFFVGALLGTFLITRLFFHITKGWDGGFKRIVFIHMFALTFVTLVSGMGLADGGEFEPIMGFKLYIFPLLFWFVVDICIYLKRKNTSRLGK